MTSPTPVTRTAADGTVFRDLNHNGTMEPYEDPRLPPAERALDLVKRMTLEEKAGMLVHPILPSGPGGQLVGQPDGPSPTHELLDRGVRHVNTFAFARPEDGAVWTNRLQSIAADSRLGIPVSVSSDPRHAFTENLGAGLAARGLSQWPEALGLAALHDPGAVLDFARIARQEYAAIGIRVALHPQVDLASDARWARQSGTFGADAELASRLVVAYLQGFQQEALGAGSVACITKHFPGGGAQLHGEDPHFPYGREQVYPAAAFEEHLLPFRAAVEAGTAGVMPSYGMPVGLVRHGRAIPEVGFAFNRPIITDLLREELGFTGVVCSDWGLVTPRTVFGKPSPARAWGLEDTSARQRVAAILAAGVDQLGGEDRMDLIIELVASGEVPEARIDASVRRLLEVQLRLGLFEDPFVDVDAASDVVGRADFVAAGKRAQSRSVTVLEGGTGIARLPLEVPLRVHLDGVDEDAARAAGFEPVARQEAELSLVRVRTPFEPRDTWFLESVFHAGSLEFPPAERDRLVALLDERPAVLDVALERGAVLTGIAEHAVALTATYGASDAAWLDALAGREEPVGHLPIELPSSMAAVEAACPDAPSSTEDPLYPIGTGA